MDTKRRLISKRRKRRTWSDDEKCEICLQTVTPGVSVAQVARRYALNANMIHAWLKDPRFAPAELEPEVGFDASDFIEVSVTGHELPVVTDVGGASVAANSSATRVDITLSDGRRILIEGPTSFMAVVGLIQGLAV